VDGDTYDIPAIILTAEFRQVVYGQPLPTFGHRQKFGNDPKKHIDFSAVTHVAKDKGIPPFLILHVAGHPDTTAQARRLGDVLKAAEGSLNRLGTDYIDFYMIHKLPPGVAEPDSLTLQAFLRLLTEGKIRHIGVSNFSSGQLKKAQSFLKEAKIEANEIEYNLFFQEAGDEVAPYCKANDIHLIAHRPLAKGALSHGENKLLDTLSRKYDKTPAQIALNFIVSQGMTAIPKASSKEHLKENIGALGWKVEEGDMILLRALDGSAPYEKIQ
jgi:diketogulonate reductase-like aldo/keto reductase